MLFIDLNDDLQFNADAIYFSVPFCYQGWVYNFRKMGKYFFFDMRDGSTHEHLQVLVDKKVRKENPGLAFGASVCVAGVIGMAPKGHIDLCAQEFQLIG